MLVRSSLGAFLAAALLLGWHFAVSPLLVDAKGNPPAPLAMVLGTLLVTWLSAGLAGAVALAVRRRLGR